MSRLLLSLTRDGRRRVGANGSGAARRRRRIAPAGARPDGLYAHFKTSMGDITIQLYEKDTPVTVRNFVGLAKGTKPWKDAKTGAMVRRPLYNNTIFHRIMLDGMIQGGDPTGTGEHECGVTIRDEFLPGLRFDRPGRLAMANTGHAELGRLPVVHHGGIADHETTTAATPIFGQVVEGQDVVKAISRVSGKHLANGGVRPNVDVKLISVTIERVGPEPAPPPAAKKASPAKK
jgi:peptidyl-prolyl cis-trans isomerase A (cyclophilin A)